MVNSMRTTLNKVYLITIGSALVISSSLFLAFLQTMFFENLNEATSSTSLVFRWQYAAPLLLSPIIEELIFRKWLPNKLQNSNLNIKESTVISNILFTALHFDLFFLPYLVNSFVYSHFYRKTMDIKVPIIIHLTYNWTIFIIACL